MVIRDKVDLVSLSVYTTRSARVLIQHRAVVSIPLVHASHGFHGIVALRRIHIRNHQLLNWRIDILIDEIDGERRGIGAAAH